MHFVIASGLLFAASIAYAGTPARNCQSAKNKAAGKYNLCRQKAEATLAKTGNGKKYALVLQKCASKFSAKWPKLETKAAALGDPCPSIGDQTSIQECLNGVTTGVANALAGGTLACSAAGGPQSVPLKTGQTQCDQGAGTLGPCPGSPSGQDGATLKGQPRSYTVNGNGTITDNKTDLIWEKLDDNDANGIHDFSKTFMWYEAFKKIEVLNGNAAGCIGANNPDACCTGAGTGSCTAFAGQTDWRLPTSFELFTLADHGRVNQAIDPTFNTSCAAACTTATCSCTQPSWYWSSSSFDLNPVAAWAIEFSQGSVDKVLKSSYALVRAVRGGS